jgi:hypothetical protein
VSDLVGKHWNVQFMVQERDLHEPIPLWSYFCTGRPQKIGCMSKKTLKITQKCAIDAFPMLELMQPE